MAKMNDIFNDCGKLILSGVIVFVYNKNNKTKQNKITKQNKNYRNERRGFTVGIIASATVDKHVYN